MGDVSGLDRLQFRQIMFDKEAAFDRVRVVVPPFGAGRFAALFAQVADQHRHCSEFFAGRFDLFLQSAFMAVRADLDLPGLAFGGGALNFHTVEQGDFFQAARALEDLGIDGVRGGRLAAAAVAAGLIEPVYFGLDSGFQFLKGFLQGVHIHWRTIVFGDKGRGRAAVNGNRFAPFHQGGQGRAAGAAEGVEHQVAGLRVMPDILADGVVRLLGPVGVHVVNGRGFGGFNRMVKGRHIVVVGIRIVRPLGQMRLHKPPQIGVRLVTRVIPLRHPRRC